MAITDVKVLGDAIAGQVGKAVIGQEMVVRRLLIALFAGGHVLLEGPPGTAKTLLAQSFARATGLEFGRIQFTPDLMPGDILGSNLFNFQTSTFSLTRGPVFTEVLLADEINRTPPKTQAALLQAMQERMVTLDGETHALSQRFTVVATQNPIESQGVYPLPEAQLDRFLFKLSIPYPTVEEEKRIVAAHGSMFDRINAERLGVMAVTNAEAIAHAIVDVAMVTVSPDIVDYVVRLIRATRQTPDLSSGASPRAAALLARASAAMAALDGRDYVIPDDVQTLAADLLRHRVLLSPAAEIDGRQVDQIVGELIAAVDAPR